MSQTTPTSESLFDGGQSLREFIAKAVQHPELMDMPMETVSGLVDTGQNRDDGLRPDMTLTEFYDAYYKPCVSVAGARSEKTMREREKSLDYWCRHTGNPPMNKITNQTTALFVTRMRQTLYRGKLLSNHTIKKHCLALAAVFNIAGRWCEKHKDAVGLLSRTPHFPTVETWDDVTWKTPTVEHVERILESADVAEYPKLPDVPAPEWWQSIYAVLYSTGLRKGDIMQAKWSDIIVINGQPYLHIPPDHEKNHQEKNIPLNETCILAINRMVRTGKDDLIFPFPHSDSTFTRTRQKIIEAAGLPTPEMGTFHGIRRLIGTIVENAQKVLGHTNPSTTRRHYQSLEVVRVSLEKLPPLKFFTKQRE